MPPLPGEERQLTVFADVHYYFSAPTPRPVHHRFDKGSYLYIYHDASQHQTRVEIANNPGTPEQDAFHGSLGNVHIRNSYKFPTLCTITVDPQGPEAATYPPPNTDPNEWRLVNTDPRDAGRYLYRLHTLDIYFWTKENADQFLDCVRSVLAQQQLDLAEPPQAQPEPPAVSSVVQQLENVAVTDPAYHQNQTRYSTSESASIAPPPPPPVAPPVQPESSSNRTINGNGSQEASVNYTPLAYNPSAPPAPEPVAYREKTPPPVGAAEGTGLATAAVTDAGQPYVHSSSQAPNSYAPPPRPAQLSQTFAQPLPVSGPNQSGYVSPPPSAGLNHTASVSSNASRGHPQSYTPQSGTTSPQAAMSFAAPPKDPNAHIYGQATPSPRSSVASPPASMSFAPPPSDPNAHLYMQQGVQSPTQQPTAGQQPVSPSPFQSQFQAQPQAQQASTHHHQPHYVDYLQTHGQPQAQAQAQAQAPQIGGYSNFSYAQQQGQPTQHRGSEYDVHTQVYRPTEAEATAYKHPHRSSKHEGQKPSKTEGKLDRVDKGVNRFLRKLEKKL